MFLVGGSLAHREDPAVAESLDSLRPDVAFRLGNKTAQKTRRVQKQQAFNSNVKEKGIVIPEVGYDFFTRQEKNVQRDLRE